MTFTAADWLLLPLAGALAVAVVTDLRARDIPNILNLGIALAAPIFWWLEALHLWPDVALQIGVAVLVFLVFALFWLRGAMGGGDLKLITALALWLPWAAVVTLLIIMSLAGGAVTAITMIEHRFRRREGRPEIPYGVAIAFAGLWLIGERYLYHFA